MYVCLGWQIPEGGDSSCQISRGGDEKGGQMPRPPTLIFSVNLFLCNSARILIKTSRHDDTHQFIILVLM